MFLQQNPPHSAEQRWQILQAVLGKFLLNFPGGKAAFPFSARKEIWGKSLTPCGLPEALTVSVHCPVDSASKKSTFPQAGL